MFLDTLIFPRFENLQKKNSVSLVKFINLLRFVSYLTFFSSINSHTTQTTPNYYTKIRSHHIPHPSMPFFKKKKDKTSNMIQSSAPESEFFGLPNYEEATFFDDVKNLTTEPIFTQEETPTTTTQLPNYIIQQSNLPMFDGSDPKGWLKAFKKEGSLYNWTDSYKLQILHSCMKEKSMAEYWWDQHYKTSPPTSFEAFEKQLIKDLSDPSDSQLLFHKELSRKQQMNESCIQFYYAKMSLITKLAENGMDIDDKFKINFVVTGLDPVYRDDAILQCTSLESLKSLLRTKDLARKMDDVSQIYPNFMISDYQRQDFPQSLTMRMPRNGYLVPRGRMEQRPPLTNNRTFDQQPYRPSNTGPHPYSQAPQNFPYNLRSFSRQRPPPPAQSNACYNCNEMGHVVRNCPYPRNSQFLSRPRPQCTYCQRFGHVRQDCRTLQRSQSQPVQPNEGQSSNQMEPKNLRHQ